MDILSDEYITWFMATHSIFIGWIKWLIYGSGATALAKLAAIVHAGTPSNKIIDLIQNSIRTQK
jgi:hypothetical protein